MNRCSFPREPVAACGLELLSAWQVEAGASYARRAERSRADSLMRNIKAGQELVAMRTVGGKGLIRCAGREHELAAGSLLLFDFPSLESYATQDKTWAFWWFEFRPTEPFRLPLHRVMNAAGSSRENKVCAEIFASLRSESLAVRCRAAALLQSQLFAWWELAGLIGQNLDRPRQKVQQLIEAMHHHPERPWTLEEMAAWTRMSTSSVRAAFHHTTGKSPARLRNQLRLAHAYEQLRRGDRNVAEVAAQLGFCDPFHFSKVFKAEYGFSPRAVLRQIR
jgi:AraC-like DNA-binding protein